MKNILPILITLVITIGLLAPIGVQSTPGQEDQSLEAPDLLDLSRVENSHLAPCFDALSANYQVDQTANTLTSFEIRPFVFVSDQRSTSKILMGVGTSTVDHISLDASKIVNWFDNTPVILRDDGMDPDERANDRLFTGNLRLANPPTQASSVQVIRNLTFTLHLKNGRVQEVTEDVASSIGVINTLRNVPVTSVASNVFRTSNVVNIVRQNLLEGTYPLIGINFFTAAQTFYRNFPDQFDWLVFFHIYNGRGSPAGSYTQVSNSIQGIGQQIINRANEYGSRGRLRGIISLFFKHAAPMSHEIFHTWGVYGFGALGLASSVGGGGHWGALANATNHTVFGFPLTLRSLTRTANGNFCGPWGSGPILGLELYLMGLAPASEIGIYQYVVDSAFVGFNCNGYEFSGSRIATLDQNAVITAFGPRVPAHPDQSDFRAAVIVVSNRALVPAEWDYVSRWFEDHASTFPRDFAGRARISYQLQ
ncbi:MAG: hypothetical protein RMM98_07970 [Acidobacteriota bacterium]|nr:hypothetical protein [Blastocatellia bacterium]MDW8239536.1 hypothetical protein [Acidobacteriota bacterium]